MSHSSSTPTHPIGPSCPHHWACVVSSRTRSCSWRVLWVRHLIPKVPVGAWRIVMLAGWQQWLYWGTDRKRVCTAQSHTAAHTQSYRRLCSWLVLLFPLISPCFLPLYLTVLSGWELLAAVICVCVCRHAFDLRVCVCVFATGFGSPRTLKARFAVQCGTKPSMREKEANRQTDGMTGVQIATASVQYWNMCKNNKRRCTKRRSRGFKRKLITFIELTLQTLIPKQTSIQCDVQSSFKKIKNYLKLKLYANCKFHSIA